MRHLLTRYMNMIRIAAVTAVVLLGSAAGFAQFTFIGDYDRTFASPFGYYVDPQNPTQPFTDTLHSPLFSGALLPDGSIVAAGRHVDTSSRGDVYLRKVTPTGAVDTSFGSGGFVRTNFYAGVEGAVGNETPHILRVQGDGKILVAGQCEVRQPGPFPSQPFGLDGCVVRYNSNGTLDPTFGGGTLAYNTYGTNETLQLDGGKMIYQTGIAGNGRVYGLNGVFRDMVIQNDGKILLVGETRDEIDLIRFAAIVVRLNPNGTLDTTFGSNGIARWASIQSVTGCGSYPSRSFFGMSQQSDGRIIAVGYDEITRGDCFVGARFAVTRWTPSGQLESVRHITELADVDVSYQERAIKALITRDGTKLIVSGSARNVSGVPAGKNKPTMAKFNLADLSLDTSFGVNGVAQYGRVAPNFNEASVVITSIQPDGKLLGHDTTSGISNVRFNPDGSSDGSFGNVDLIDFSPGGRGRLRIKVTNFEGTVSDLQAVDTLLRPDGKFNLIGWGTAFDKQRGAVSQNINILRSGVLADFENDGKANLSVYRPNGGVWHNLDSRNNAYTTSAFGLASDKLAPADYDGDGKTDRAVFRDGIWYIERSLNGQVRITNFGLAGDLPRPGDFDGDGVADLGVFRPSNGTWHRLESQTGAYRVDQFGMNGDTPMLGDYDADGRTDLAVFRASGGAWYILYSSNGQVRAENFGLAGDVPVNGDFNGDSRADLAVFRPSNGTWYIARPTGVPSQNFDATGFGAAGDIPVAADYDNDGRTDIAVYRNGVWWILNSGTAQVSVNQFGLAGDKPVPAAYLP